MKTSIGPIHCRILPDGRSIQLLEPLEASALGLTIVVPAGFESDAASVPRLFWRTFPPWGRYTPAAVVHDWLYVCRHDPRAEADAVFLELMAHLRVPWLQRRLMFRAVRLFGRYRD